MTKLKNYTLVIIDMQPQFEAANGNQKLYKRIKKAMDAAMRLGNHIMFVWLPTCGPISSTLKDHLQGYPNVSFVSKADQDGGHDVLKALPKKNHLRFCGVNTDQCVKDTVITVARNYSKRFKIELIKDGCATYLSVDAATTLKRHNNAVRSMNRYKNIRIVK